MHIPSGVCHDYRELQVTGPPGGASSISLGWSDYSPAPAPARRAAPAPSAVVDPYKPAPVAAADPYKPAAVYSVPSVPMASADSKDNVLHGAGAPYVGKPAAAAAVPLIPSGAGAVSANSFACGANQNCGMFPVSHLHHHTNHSMGLCNVMHTHATMPA